MPIRSRFFDDQSERMLLLLILFQPLLYSSHDVPPVSCSVHGFGLRFDAIHFFFSEFSILSLFGSLSLFVFHSRVVLWVIFAAGYDMSGLFLRYAVIAANVDYPPRILLLLYRVSCNRTTPRNRASPSLLYSGSSAVGLSLMQMLLASLEGEKSACLLCPPLQV